MTVSIIHALLRWILDVFAPGTGNRRAGARPLVTVPAEEPERLGPVTVRLPAHRSPYGLFAPLDGSAAASVRPYVIAAEWTCQAQERERAQQMRRRVALVLAADFGIDLDRRVVGAEGVA